MRKAISEIIGFGMEPERAECKCNEVVTIFEQFIVWKDHPTKCPFEIAYNGTDKSKPKIMYRKGASDKDWLLSEVFRFWFDNVYQKTNP